MPFKAILLQGHTRNLTHVLFNRESDLLFTCAKDTSPQVWYTSNGERLGTFEGHTGAISECDVSYDSKRLITASFDMTVKLWDVYTGTNLCTFSHKAPVKSVAFATGETMALAAQNRVGKTPSRIFIYNISEDSKEQDLESVLELDNPTLEHNFTKAMWSRLNSHIYTSDEGGVVSVWDVETATAVHSLQAHKKRINSMTASIDKNLLLTASSDMTAKLIDTRLDRPIDVSNPADQHFIDIRTFQLDRPINCCALSPILNHAMFAGGQEAIDVTLSSNKEGKFETDFFHVVYGEKLASLKGHFGPVNTMAVSPNGKMFATGGEDGIVRLHHFDQGYLSSTY